MVSTAQFRQFVKNIDVAFSVEICKKFAELYQKNVRRVIQQTSTCSTTCTHFYLFIFVQQFRQFCCCQAVLFFAFLNHIISPGVCGWFYTNAPIECRTNLFVLWQCLLRPWLNNYIAKQHRKKHIHFYYLQMKMVGHKNSVRQNEKKTRLLCSRNFWNFQVSSLIFGSSRFWLFWQFFWVIIHGCF